MDNNQNYTPDYAPEMEPQIPTQINGKPLKRRKYLFTAAPQKTRIMSFVALGLSALFVLLTIIGTIISLSAPMWDIPLFSIAVGEQEMDELEESCEELQDEIKDAIREDNETLIAELEDDYDMNIKEIQKIVKTPSLLNGSKLVLGMNDSEGIEAFGLIIVLVLGFAGIVLLFSALATLFLKKGLLITAYIFAIPFCLLFAGTALLVLATVILIAFIVMQVLIDSDYRGYKNDVRAQKS